MSYFMPRHPHFYGMATQYRLRTGYLTTSVLVLAIAFGWFNFWYQPMNATIARCSTECSALQTIKAQKVQLEQRIAQTRVSLLHCQAQKSCAASTDDTMSHLITCAQRSGAYLEQCSTYSEQNQVRYRVQLRASFDALITFCQQSQLSVMQLHAQRSDKDGYAITIALAPNSAG